jgi:uncharacterized membrane protein
VWSWSAARTTPLWYAPAWLRWVLVAVMLVAFVLFVASVSQRNPTMVSGETAMAQPPVGIYRVTRHPMLWSFALWAAVHIIGNGDSAAIAFFGTFLVTALVGMPSIDASWRGAIRAGRHRPPRRRSCRLPPLRRTQPGAARDRPALAADRVRAVAC